jgi:hypothetical protein
MCRGLASAGRQHQDTNVAEQDITYANSTGDWRLATGDWRRATRDGDGTAPFELMADG